MLEDRVKTYNIKECHSESKALVAEQRLNQNVKNWCMHLGRYVGGYLNFTCPNFNLIECDKPGLQNYYPNFGGNHDLFIVQVLKIGVRIGAEFAVKWGEEEKFGVVIRREDVTKVVNDLMNENGEGQDRRQRAK